MKKKGLLFLLVLFISVSFSEMIFAQDPFGDGGTSQEREVKKSLKQRFSDLQRQGDNLIKKKLRGLKREKDLGTILFILGFSFLYGIFHAIGPGHGKVLVTSYFAQGNGTKLDAFILSLIISIMHSFMSILLAILYLTVLSHIKGFEQMRVQSLFLFISGILVIIVAGLNMLEKVTGKEIVHFAHSDNKIKNNFFIGLSIGVVPCPLSIAVMTFAIGINMVWLGVLSVLALTFSMSVLLFIIALYTIKFTDSIKKRSPEKKGFLIFSTVLSYIGTVFLVFLGIYFTYIGAKGYFI